MSSYAEVHLEPGEILYHEGEPNDCAYIIESGEVVLFSQVDGKRIDCERRGENAIVGELSILTNRPRTVTVEALTQCRIFRVSADQILARFERLDPLLRACIKTSLNFNTRMAEQISSQYVPFAPSTLSNARDIVEQFKFENDILEGLDNREFSLVYQPIVRLSNNTMIGVEALMRWQHPELGNIPPFKFIEVAEAMGSIAKITNFALSEACAALRRIRQAKPESADFYASINVSGKDIVRVGFVDLVAHVLDINELDPSTLKVEVTETSLINNPEFAAKQLAQLRALGCGISIDDFGTGYSNLAYLKELPLTALKIDRTFAGDAFANATSRSIVKMLLGLGKEMKVDIIAEGLETQDDVDTLRTLGCHYAQGYHYSKPVPEAEIIQTIMAKRNAA